MTVQEIIEAAYLRSTRNVPGKTAQDPELIGFLSRVYCTYYLLMAKAAPDRFESELVLVLGGAPAQAALPATVHDVRYVSWNGVDVSIIPIEEQFRTWHLAPCVIWLGLTLRSRGSVGDPTIGSALSAIVLAGAAALTTLASVLDSRFTDEYTELLVDEVAMYLALKDSNRDPAEYAKLKSERDMRGAAFLRLNGYATSAMRTPAIEAIQSARGEGVPA